LQRPCKKENFLLKGLNGFSMAFLLVLLWSCGSSDDQNFPNVPPGINSGEFSNVKPANPSSPYKTVIIPCIAARKDQDTCRLSELPLIGQEKNQPTIMDVMDRVVVSHDWMGERFQQVLEQLPPDILKLMKAITAVVIDDDIRPSYYGITGAIYLDPANLWLTNDEKQTISKRDDFRINFGTELQFLSFSRYVKDNQYAYRFYSLEGTETRNLDDIIFRVAALLYHELAHANDLFPPNEIPQLDSSFLIKNSMDNLLDLEKPISFLLNEHFPLTSEEMEGLADVLFKGIEPTDEQKIYTATQVGSFFKMDRANDDYNFSSIFEDLAMLFEEVMMKYHFDIERDIAFLDKPNDPTLCENYKVAWGNRQRIGNLEVKIRAQFVTNNLLPKEVPSQFFIDLEDATQMKTGVDWCKALKTKPIISSTVDEKIAKADFPEEQQVIKDSLPGHL